MLEISYFGFFIILLMATGFGLLLGVALKKRIEEKQPQEATIYFDYKTSKDYDRLYELLSKGQTVLIRSCIKNGCLSNHFYNAFKSHRDDEYYMAFGMNEKLPDKEKFTYFCKFKDIEFLDFVTEK